MGDHRTANGRPRIATTAATDIANGTGTGNGNGNGMANGTGIATGMDTGFARQHGRDPAEAPAPARWIALRDWPVSRRLFALIALALILGLVFGGFRVAAATDSASEFSRVAQLAQLGEQVTVLVQALQDERDQTAGVTPTAKPAQTAAGLTHLYQTTDAAAAQVRTLAAHVDGAFPANIQAQVATVLSDLAPGQAAGLSVLRRTALTSQSALAVIVDYSGPIGDMITLTGQIAEGSNDSGLTTSVQSLTALAQAKDQASRQRALLFNALTQGQFADGELQALQTAITAEASDLATFGKTASPADASLERSMVAGPLVNKADLIAEYVTGASGLDLSALNIPPKKAAAQWFTAMSATVQQLQAVEQHIAKSVVDRSKVLRGNAARSALVIAMVTLAVLLIVLAITVVVARSMVRALRTLREGALAIATVHLPERVRQLGEAADPVSDLTVAPIEINSSDEIGQVARAFDQVHAEAIRLAGNEAMLRTSFNAMFVNLSRRSQLLIERLARTIDSLEQREDDPDRLADLFSMDHMVTRMRRNSENLLLLAGHEGTRKWSEPVSLANVTRAATSEIEQYSRVSQRVPPDIAVSGRAVSDVVHLLAEIIENATIFSAHDTQVLVAAERVATGGVLVQVSDTGVGIPEARLAELNARLDDPPDMDISVSRHMGLYAVARLARRLSVRVRLLAGTPRGLDALVWLPDAILEREIAPAPWQAGDRQSAALTSASRTGSGSFRQAAAPSVPSFADSPSYTDSPSYGESPSYADASRYTDSTVYTDSPSFADSRAYPDTRSTGETPAYGAMPSFTSPAPAFAPPAAPPAPMTRGFGRPPGRLTGSATSPWFRSNRASALSTGPAGRPAMPAASGPAVSGPAVSGPAAPMVAASGSAAAVPATAAPAAPVWGEVNYAPPVMEQPADTDYTQAGLPKRVPKPNPAVATPVLSAPAHAPQPTAPEPSRPEPASRPPRAPRTPELARSRLSGFQRGIRRAKSAPSTRERIVD